MREYLLGCLDEYFHVNRQQTLFYRCLSAFFLAFITALWSPSLIIVLLFVLLFEVVICSSSICLGRQWCILSRSGMLAAGVLGWICGRALSEHAIGIEDEPDTH